MCVCARACICVTAALSLLPVFFNFSGLIACIAGSLSENFEHCRAAFYWANAPLAASFELLSQFADRRYDTLVIIVVCV